MTPPNALHVTLPYTPRPPQDEIHAALESHHFCVLVSHRQMGKTVCAVNHLIKQAMLNTRPDPRYFYVSPFLKQTKLIAWDYVKRFSSPIPGVKINEMELTLRLPNGAKIWLLGADNPDALRGTYADGVVLDEYAQIKEDVFDEIVRPMLLSRDGWVVFMGTPKGQNQFYRLFMQAREAARANPQLWWVGVYSAQKTGVIPERELEQLRHSTPQALFRQEYLCDFSATSDDVLIKTDAVAAACGRYFSPAQLAGAPKVVGVDPARFGEDRSVIVRRQGAQAYAPLVFKHMDQMALAAQTARVINEFKPDAVFIDAGCGGGVIDRLRQLGFGVSEINFGAAASLPGRYVNKRAEMWDAVRAWVETGALDTETDWTADLCAARFDFDAQGRLRLESKQTLKGRTGLSPDLGDALALTFAAPVLPRAARAGARFAKTEYDVI